VNSVDVAPQPPEKKQNGRFPSKSALSKKVCYKVCLRENRQRQSCKAFIGLSIGSKMVGSKRPFFMQILPKLTTLIKNADFQSVFARSASAVVAKTSKKFK